MEEKFAPLVRIENISKTYQTGRHSVEAVKNVSLEIKKGEVVGLAGESGCGKSTLGKIIINLTSPTKGHIYFNEQDLSRLSAREMRIQRRSIQMILQDPYGSLNPKLRVVDIVAEGLNIHGIPHNTLIEEALDSVGLSSTLKTKYPRELSGGQRQRVNIARALVLKPTFLVLDESVSALDVSHQRQILTLLQGLKEKHNLTFLFISHDLTILRAICDRIGIMYRGELVELGCAEQVISHPKHPYTQALISAVPIPDPILEKSRRRLVLMGEPPSPFQSISGCQFHPRCPYVQEVCKTTPPIFEGGVSCHLTKAFQVLF